MARRATLKIGKIGWMTAIAGLLLAIVATIVASAPATASSPPTWAQPVGISLDLPSSWFPDIQADPTGAVRLVWSANLATGNGNLTHADTGAVMVSQLGDKGWSTPGDVAVMDAGIASRPLITSDGNFVHMLYRSGSLGVVSLYYTRAAAKADLGNAHAWSTPLALASDAYYAQIVVLPDQSLLVLYNQEVDITPETMAAYLPPLYRRNLAYVDPKTATEQRTALFARRSIDHGNTWSQPVRVADGISRVGRVSVAVSADGKAIIAAWDEGYDNQTGQGTPQTVGTAISADGGASWSDQHTISSPGGPIEESAVAIGHDESVLAYRSTVTTQILYRTSGDGGRTWSPEKAIPQAVARPYLGTHNFDKMGMAVDSDGRVLLTYVGSDAQAPKGLSVMVTSYDGGWTPPVRVASPDGYPEYPRLAVALGNQLTLVYFVRDNEFDVGHYTLWSVAGHSDAPAVPVVHPVLAAVPTPKPVPLATEAAALPTPPPAEIPPDLNRTEIRTPESILGRPMVFASIATAAALASLLVLAGMTRFLIRIRD